MANLFWHDAHLKLVGCSSGKGLNGWYIIIIIIMGLESVSAFEDVIGDLNLYIYI